MKFIQDKTAKRRAGGFTLIELLVVILILAILAALIVPRIVGRSGEAKVGAAQADIRTISDGVRQFRLDVGRYPTTEEGLNALMDDPGARGWKGRYLEKLPLDPWGNEYAYEASEEDFVVISLGLDGQEGGEGEAADVRSDE